MMRALWSSATGMRAQQLNIDTISNNLANVNTTGFKKSVTTFQDLIYDTLKPAGASNGTGSGSAVGIDLGLGTSVVASNKIFTSGKPQQTGNQYDLWISGPGFFQLTRPDGTEAYSRDGAFHLDANGQLVNGTGLPLANVPNIDPNATQVAISETGIITQFIGDQTTELGQIQLYNFPNPAGLSAEGSNLYVPNGDASGAAVTGTPGSTGFGTVRQGFLELSNVEVVDEMVNLIVAQRAYEINTKAIQASDEMLQTANNIRR